MHDIYEPHDPPDRREIPIYAPTDRIGLAGRDRSAIKIAGVVVTDLDDECGSSTRRRR